MATANKKLDGVIHYSGFFLSTLGALTGILAISHTATPSHYGALAIYIAISNLFTLATKESISNTILNDINPSPSILHHFKTLPSEAKFNLSLLLILTIILGAFVSENGLVDTALILTFSFFLSLSTIMESVFSSLKKRSAYSIHLIIKEIPRFVFAYFFYSIEPSVTSLLAGFTFGLIITFVFDYHLSARIGPDLPIHAKRHAKHISVAPLIGLVTWGVLFLDRFVINYLIDAESLGGYFLLMQIGFAPIWSVTHAVAQYITPQHFKFNNPTNQSLSILARSYRVFFLFGLLIFTTSILFHHEIFKVLVGEEYRSFSSLLPWVIVNGFIFSFTQIARNSFYISENVKPLLRINIYHLGLQVILLTIGASTYQLKGAIIGQTFGALLSMVFIYTEIKKAAKTLI